MANVLLTWELGFGMGHLIPHLPLLNALESRGHQVFFAVKDLSPIPEVLNNSGVQCLQAPLRAPHRRPLQKKVYTVAHLLENIGYRDTVMMTGLVRGWRALYDIVDPDVTIFDFSPTALLAARGYGFGKMVYGQGFHSPPDQYPLPNMRLSEPADTDRLQRDEDRVIAAINKLLFGFGEPPIEHIAELFRADANLLMTVKELDLYPGRNNGQYWGLPTGTLDGESTVWPPGEGPRIFAYLKPCRALEDLLRFLAKLDCPILVVGASIPAALREQYSCTTLRFLSTVPNMDQLVHQCDIGVTHGTLTVTRLLLAGKPALIMPLALEHRLVALRAKALGAALMASSDDGSMAIDRLQKMLAAPEYAAAAQEFSQRYQDFDAAQQVTELVTLIESLATRK